MKYKSTVVLLQIHFYSAHRSFNNNITPPEIQKRNRTKRLSDWPSLLSQLETEVQEVIAWNLSAWRALPPRRLYVSYFCLPGTGELPVLIMPEEVSYWFCQGWPVGKWLLILWNRQLRLHREVIEVHSYLMHFCISLHVIKSGSFWRGDCVTHI